MENSGVSKERIEALAEVVYQLREQLEFYREIGIGDLGDSQTPAARVLGVRPNPPLKPETAVEASAETLQPSTEAAIATATPQETPEATTASTQENTEEAAPAAPPATPIPAPPLATDSLLPVESPQVLPAPPVATAPPAAQGLFREVLFQQESPPEAPTDGLPRLSLYQDASLDAIRADLGDCTRCKLHAGRRRIVFGEGNPQARLMFVGEGPGADEDASGRPFVGAAGQLLDKIIKAIEMRRDEVYIANVVKCRPPGNRTPERDEVETCEPFLFRQIACIRPRVIVTLGAPAFQCLFNSRESISRARGAFREWHGIRVMPTFHPAFLLRSPEKKREVWEDMKKVRDYLQTLAD